MSYVIDYVSERTDHDDMRAAGVVGVVRYLATPPNDKIITPGEYRRLCAAGLEVALVWEDGGSRTNDGHDAGLEDGQAAASQAAALGYPPDHVIYWAVDHDPVGDDIDHAKEYGRGFAQACSYLARPYGNDKVVTAVVEAGIADGGWQCRAWSGKPIRYSSHRVLFQHDGPANLALSGVYDTDDIHRPDWASTTAAPNPEENDMQILAATSNGTYWLCSQDTRWHIPDPDHLNALRFMQVKDLGMMKPEQDWLIEHLQPTPYGVGADPAAIAAQITATLTPALAQSVADELAKRL